MLASEYRLVHLVVHSEAKILSIEVDVGEFEFSEDVEGPMHSRRDDV